jgi:hypothetical protein
LIVAERQSLFGVRRWARWRATSATLSIEGSPSTIAFDIHLEDGRVVNETIDGGERHGRIGEDFSPFTKRLIGRDEERTPLIARADELEQHAGLRLVLADVGEVIEWMRSQQDNVRNLSQI